MLIDERVDQRTVAEAMAEALAAMGVTRAFGVSGGAISFFWTALAGSRIAVTHFRHESGAGFAACEASIATGAPVLVFVTTGPGLTNVLTSVYAARHEGARLILVGARTDPASQGRGPIQETGPRTLPHEGIFTAGPLFDYAATVTGVGDLVAVVEALAEGLGRPAGFVAHVSLSLSVQRATVTARPPTAPVTPSVGSPDREARLAHRTLRDRPWVMWVGRGAREAADPVRRLARAAGVPVMATPRGKGVFPEDDAAYLGVTGIGGHDSVRAHLRSHPPEHVLVLGSRLGDSSSGYSPAYVPRSSFIHVDVDPSVPGAAYPEAATMAVHGDVGTFCDRLAELFERDGVARATPDVRARPFDDRETTPRSTHLVDPRDVMDAVQRVFVDGGTLVMVETGNAFAWAVNRLRLRDPLRWRTCSGLVASMGHFATGVVGPAIATGGSAVAITGDGTMLMANEVSTAVHEGAPAIWVVLNDARYNMCAQGVRALGLPAVDCAIPPTDFALLAEALGARGLVVRRPAELVPAFTAALALGRPVVVDVRIDPEPAAPAGGRNAGLMRDSAGGD
jgi:acetolactate synthase-1/2/3 large subunit